MASSASGRGAWRSAIALRRCSSGSGIDRSNDVVHPAVAGDRDVGLLEVGRELATVREQAHELRLDDVAIHVGQPKARAVEQEISA